MNLNRQSTSSQFAEALREALVRVYGSPPSAAKLADAFNLRAHGTSTISRETARKWLKGQAIPEIGRMRVLITWLGLNPASFLQPIARVDDESGLAAPPSGNSDDQQLRETLLALLDELDKSSVEVLCLTALAMRKVGRKTDIQ